MLRSARESERLRSICSDRVCAPFQSQGHTDVRTTQQCFHHRLLLTCVQAAEMIRTMASFRNATANASGLADDTRALRQAPVGWAGSYLGILGQDQKE